MSPVLSFVEGSEYRRTLARELAKRLVGEIGVTALLEGGDQIADDLLAVLGEDIAGLTRQALADAIRHAGAMGLATVDDAAAAATVQDAIERVMTAARASLTARLADLDATVARMIGASSSEAVLASLASQATSEALLAPIVATLSAAAAGAVQAVEADIATEAAAQTHEQAIGGGDAPPLFEWQTREDDRVCEDVFENSCAPRHGKQLQFDEWGIFGMPGDPDAPTICAIYAKNPGASNCRCVLIEAGSAASTPTPVNITDAAKAGRDRALAEAA
jgi:hypothetical protein